MVKLSACALDREAVEKGRWFEWVNGARFRVRPISHSDFQAELATHRDIHRTAIDAAPDTPEVKAIMDASMLKSIPVLVTEVQGLEDEDGTPVVYSREWLHDLLTQDGFRHLYAWIISVAATAESFTVQGDRADAGNFARRFVGI